MAAALANHYARALADVVARPGAPAGAEAAKTELAGFVAAFQTSPELRSVLASPAVPPDKKKAVIDRIGSRLAVSRVVRNFLYVVADHRRMALLEEMLGAFEALLDERMGVVRAEVVSAQAIEAPQQAQLAEALGRLTGKQVRPAFSVDPALLGGAVARIGTTVYDGSVRGRLQTLARRLTTE